VIAPSGEQIKIAAGDQRAVVVEVGGGLRSYSAGGRELVDGYRADEMSSSGRGQVLIPWPNRLQDGSFEFDGRRHQLPLNEPEHRNAIHGLVRWAAWTAAEREPHRVVMKYVLYPQPGYPFSLGISIEYALSDSGLRVRTTATNLGTDTCPYGSGAHSDPRDRNYRSFDFARTRANRPAVRRARPSDQHGCRGGHGIRFSAAEADRLDYARPCVHRP
jgi:aldose 1-epimerase